MQQPLDFIEKNRDRFLEELKELVRIESISTQPAKKGEVLRCAEVEVKKLKEIGLENAQLLQTEGYPLVYGDWLHAPGKPTLLIYGHYDVQPPDPLDQWTSPPFEPTVRDGNLYGRGTSDNKAQHYIYIAAIEAYLKTVGKLPVNVKLLIEGEEESGSGAIDRYVPTHADFLKCDAVLISDTAWHDAEHPSTVYSLRGLVYCEVSVHGPSHDLHSGHYGGLVRNPLQVLSSILSKLKDENEKILIPGFYDAVKAMTPEEKKDAAAVPFSPSAMREEMGVSELVSEAGFTSVEANWARPTCDICGISGGYQQPGAKTIIPASASAKVSFRIVANQDPQEVGRQFEKYVRSLTPKGVRVEVKAIHWAKPFYVDRNNPYLQKAAKAFETCFGKQMIFIREGATIPITAAFQSVLKAPVIMIGIGLPDDRLHSPNEKISLTNFFNGIKGAALAMEELGKG